MLADISNNFLLKHIQTIHKGFSLNNIHYNNHTKLIFFLPPTHYSSKINNLFLAHATLPGLCVKKFIPQQLIVLSFYFGNKYWLKYNVFEVSSVNWRVIIYQLQEPAMAAIVTLFYILFSVCMIYPPTEFVSAGFTIPQIFDGFLGSENLNFVGYHMKRITITAFAHSMLPLGYVFSLWCGGVTNQWLPAAAAATAIIPLLMCYQILCWWEHDKAKHPVVRPLIKYSANGSDWRIIAAQLNREFRR